MLPSHKTHRCWKKNVEPWVNDWLRSQWTYLLSHHWPVYLAVGLLAKSTLHYYVQGHQVNVFKNLDGCFLRGPRLLPFILSEEAKINILTIIKWPLLDCFSPYCLRDKTLTWQELKARSKSPMCLFWAWGKDAHARPVRKSMTRVSRLANGLSATISALQQMVQSSAHHLRLQHVGFPGAASTLNPQPARYPVTALSCLATFQINSEHFSKSAPTDMPTWKGRDTRGPSFRWGATGK